MASAIATACPLTHGTTCAISSERGGKPPTLWGILMRGRRGRECSYWLHSSPYPRPLFQWREEGFVTSLVGKTEEAWGRGGTGDA